MEPERYRRVKELLGLAMDLPAAERPAFLARECGDDALRREVEELLAVEGEADVLDQPAVSLRGGEEVSAAGRRFGPYEIEAELGRGGMGAVLLARRADRAFEKKVAIKLLKRGMDSEEIVQRFRHERRILAQLEHPNVARLIDAGTTDDGLPYFVMEHVEGVAIDRYCDDNRLSTSQRLELFRKVCSAVSFAHRQLVVHRDLKPGNILVTADGVPKLLDFGIAKLLDPETGREGELTVEGLRAMTPEYASPEQLEGLPVTTASDVYSLGVLLYVLLTGHRPYRLTTRSAAEVARVVRTQDPERPSTAVKRVEELPSRDGGLVRLTPKTVSAPREGEPERLRRRLAGDLDHIVLKALRREPEARYESVEQLSDDIERHLRSLPVLARRGTLSYRIGRFLKRHWAAVAAAAVFVALVVGFGVREAQRSRELERALDDTRQVADFLEDIFANADPERARGEALTVRELLDAGAQRIRDELEDQPAVRAKLLDTMGRAYRKLGQDENASELLEEALEIRRRTFGADHEDVASSLQNLGAFYRDQGRGERAEELMREALEIRRRIHGAQDHEELAIAHGNLGLLLQERGELEEAEAHLSRALEIDRRLGDGERIADRLNDLATLQARKGATEAAEASYREALALLRAEAEPDQLYLASLLNNYGSFLYGRGRSEEAAALLREAFEIRSRIYPAGHSAVTRTLANLASAAISAGSFESLEPELRKTEATQRREGARPPELARILRHRAFSELRHGRPAAAETLAREALEIFLAEPGDGGLWIADLRGLLGESLVALSRFDEAEPLLVASHQAMTAAWGARSARAEQARARLTALYQAWGRPAEAARFERPPAP